MPRETLERFNVLRGVLCLRHYRTGDTVLPQGRHIHTQREDTDMASHTAAELVEQAREAYDAAVTDANYADRRDQGWGKRSAARVEKAYKALQAAEAAVVAAQDVKVARQSGISDAGVLALLAYADTAYAKASVLLDTRAKVSK